MLSNKVFSTLGRYWSAILVLAQLNIYTSDTNGGSQTLYDYVLHFIYCLFSFLLLGKTILKSLLDLIVRFQRSSREWVAHHTIVFINMHSHKRRHLGHNSWRYLLNDIVTIGRLDSREHPTNATRSFKSW